MTSTFVSSLPNDVYEDLLSIVVEEEYVCNRYSDIAAKLRPFVESLTHFNTIVFPSLCLFFTQGFKNEEIELINYDIPRKKNNISDEFDDLRVKRRNLIKKRDAYIMRLKLAMFPKPDDTPKKKKQIKMNDLIRSTTNCVLTQSGLKRKILNVTANDVVCPSCAYNFIFDLSLDN